MNAMTGRRLATALFAAGPETGLTSPKKTTCPRCFSCRTRQTVRSVLTGRDAGSIAMTKGPATNGNSDCDFIFTVAAGGWLGVSFGMAPVRNELWRGWACGSALRDCHVAAAITQKRGRAKEK